MLKERIDDLIDILSEEYSKLENTFLVKNNEQLLKYADDPKEWKRKQFANRQAYKKELVKEATQRIGIINEKNNKVLLLAYKEVDKDIISIQEKEIVINGDQKQIAKRLRENEKFNAERVKELVNTAFKTYERTVRLIDSTYKTDKIFEGIKSQMAKGIQNGLSIVYKDGRKMNFKSYMEMNARTTLQQETSQRQMEAGARAGQIFYVCDSFSDCAPDHADFQGKIYYNEQANIPEDVQKFIDENGIMSMQEVVNGEPYLTSRPNCRHNLHAVPTDEVMSGKSGLEIAQVEGFVFGKYEESNYKDLQEQRYNERQIRKWKLRAENQERVDKITGTPNSIATQKAKSKVSEWQSKQRDLIKSNPDVLKRQYERENAKVIVEDLGVKYRYKVVDGQLERKK